MTNDFRMDDSGAAKEAVRQGVARFWLDRIAEMVRHVMYRGNLNRGCVPVPIVAVKVSSAASWPLKGSIVVTDAESRRFRLQVTKKGFNVREV